MNNSREIILDRIKKATTSLPTPARRPDYEASLTVSHAGQRADNTDNLSEYFASQWKANKGQWANDWEYIREYLISKQAQEGYCAPEFYEKLKSAWPDTRASCKFLRSEIEKYAFGITPAWGAIAETGTIILTDFGSPTRLGALAPWIHIAVIPENKIFPTLNSAILDLPKDPSIIFVTGPSKTADIEGILIEGVHGPGIQFAMIY